MTAVHLDHSVVAVSEWNAANRFYGEVVGAEVVECGPGRFAYRIGDTQLNVQRHCVTVETGPVPRFGARGSGVSVYFRDPHGSLLEFISYDETT